MWPPMIRQSVRRERKPNAFGRVEFHLGWSGVQGSSGRRLMAVNANTVYLVLQINAGSNARTQAVKSDLQNNQNKGTVPMMPNEGKR